ncbi:THUMP-like domain-containing protein [Demequina aurantiaca]|uniref:THUMP-like domain-containing protein n=1 Tax=Demequina aurantiaca TaxID=676200 RepID=UPI003D33C12A
MDPSTARLVTSADGLSLIDSLPPYSEPDALSLGAGLRKAGADGQSVAAAMTQSRLRAAARSKFGEFADGMLFTQDGLEQATRLSVAALHATRFREAGCTRIADLTAGIGADAMAASALGLPVVAFELDEATALIADHNLRHWPETQVVHADSIKTLNAPGAVAALGIDGIFADPARRNARGRRHDPKDYSPALDAVLALREMVPELGVKVGPAIDHDAIPTDVEAQWVSVDGSVVEASLWSGKLARFIGHTALVISDGQAHHLEGTTDRAPEGALAEYIYEPDGAVIRSGLVGEVAATIGAHLVDPSIAYLTCDSEMATPFARGYRVLDSLPYSVKRLASALHAREVGIVDIKKRGIDITPERLRPQLKLRGDAHAMVILTRIAGRHQALIVEPLDRH